MLRQLATAILLSIAFASQGFAAEGKAHRVAIQIDQNDPQVMKMAAQQRQPRDRLLPDQE